VCCLTHPELLYKRKREGLVCCLTHPELLYKRKRDGLVCCLTHPELLYKRKREGLVCCLTHPELLAPWPFMSQVIPSPELKVALTSTKMLLLTFMSRDPSKNTPQYLACKGRGQVAGSVM
jgi:hypothetical protein